MPALTMQPTPERMSMAGKDYEVGGQGAERVLRVVDQLPLERLFARNVIERRQYDAGERLRAHWYYSGMSPVGAIDYGGTHGSASWDHSAMPKSERQAYHRRELRSAQNSLKRHSGILMAVVIDEVSPEEYGRLAFGRNNRNEARAAAIEVLKLALDCAADHWGM